jgi:hypothetical protein
MNDLSRRGTRRRGNSKATGDGKRFVVPADEKLAAFVELERAIREPQGIRCGRPLADELDRGEEIVPDPSAAGN